MIYPENILICIVVPLLIAMFFVSGNAWRFVFAFAIGMGICLLSAYISGFFELQTDRGAEWVTVYLSPVIEEIMKFLPILFYMIVLKYDNKRIFLVAAAIGAGFATFENCCYMLAGGTGHFGYMLIRGLAVGVMHIDSILVVTLAMVLIRKFRILSIPGAVGALSISMTIHSLYNLLVSKPGITTYIGYVIPILVAVLIYPPCKRLREETQEDGS